MNDETPVTRRKRRWPIGMLALLVIGIGGWRCSPKVRRWLARRPSRATDRRARRLGRDNFARPRPGEDLLPCPRRRSADRGHQRGGRLSADGAIAGRIDRIEIERLDIHLKYAGRPQPRRSRSDDPAHDPGCPSANAPPPAIIIIHQIVAGDRSPIGSIGGEGMATFDQKRGFAAVRPQRGGRAPPYRPRYQCRPPANADPAPGQDFRHVEAVRLWQFLGLPQPSAGSMDIAAAAARAAGDRARNTGRSGGGLDRQSERIGLARASGAGHRDGRQRHRPRRADRGGRPLAEGDRRLDPDLTMEVTGTRRRSSTFSPSRLQRPSTSNSPPGPDLSATPPLRQPVLDLGLAIDNQNGEIGLPPIAAVRSASSELKIGKDLAIGQLVTAPIKNDSPIP